MCSWCRVLPVVEEQRSFPFFLFLFFFSAAVTLAATILFAVVAYCVNSAHSHCLWPVHVLRKLLNALRWVLFCPFMEAFISVFECENGYHKLHDTTRCFSGSHIFFVLLSVICSLLLLFLVFIANLFYGERQAAAEDAEAKLTDSSDALFLAFRLAAIIFVSFNRNVPAANL